MVLCLAALIAPLIALLLWLEKKYPIEARQPRADIVANYKLVAINVLVNQMLRPLTGASSAAIVGAAGGGFIELRTDGWWFFPSLIAMIVAIDLFAYLLHRAQHCVPALWAMHSLHHSAESLTVVAGARHYWFEGIATVAFLPVLEILFKIPLDLLLVGYVLYFLPDQCAHLNIKFSLGRFALWINNPQYHRIHHSVLPEHRDKNFCKLLPIFDVIFGTAWRPAKDEFPPTGLARSEQPAGFLDGFTWPLRHQLGLAKEGV